jgi:hypothetical protein
MDNTKICVRNLIGVAIVSVALPLAVVSATRGASVESNNSALGVSSEADQHASGPILAVASAKNITGTTIAQSVVERANKAFAKLGRIPSGKLKVVQFRTNDIVAASDLSGVSVSGDGMSVDVADPPPEKTNDNTRDGAYWEFQNTKSYYYESASEHAYVAHRFVAYRLVGDKSATYDYRQMEHEGTTGPTVTGWAVENASLRVDDYTDGHVWSDWDPKGDQGAPDGGCNEKFNVQIIVLTIEIHDWFRRCRFWDMTRSQYAGDYSMKFTCTPPLDGDCFNHDFELGYMTAIRVGQWVAPTRTLYASVDGAD